MREIDINCDMGESYGLYKMGDDEAIIPYITQANVACGFHASDPSHMRRTVELAREAGVKVGAHFSFPDLAGFGRREMKIEREELSDIIIYQIGALSGFLDICGVKLSHLKPHGALYGLASRDQEVAEAVADAAKHYGVPVLGLAGTLHEQVFRKRGIGFKSEFFADLEYTDEGKLIITREHQRVDPARVAQVCTRAIVEGKARSINGKDFDVRVESICMHSDTPNAVDIAREVQKVVRSL